MPDDREAESQPAKTSRRRTVSLTKAIEYARQKLRIDSLTRVLHGHTRVRSVLVDTHRDLSTMRRELHRIRQQVPDDLMQARRVGRYRTHSRFGVIIDIDALSVSRGLHDIDRRTRDRSYIQRPHFEIELAGNDARRVEQIVDQLRLHTRVAIDCVETLRQNFLITFAFTQHAGPAE